jgi:membrane-associated phospholipid phosphatase
MLTQQLTRDASMAMDEAPLAREVGWTPPQLVFSALVLAAAAAVALFIDLPLARYFQDPGLPKDLQRLVRLAEVFGWGGSVALIILTAAVLDSRGWRVLPRLAAGTALAGLSANAIKLLIARQRPVAADLAGEIQATFVAWLPVASREDISDYGYKLQSFPSGHAATAAGLAIALAALYPRGRWLFIAFAALAALQRMDARAHFASDVLAAGALACLIGAVLELKARRL